MPKVSIILPTYNGEKYIEESIDSIIFQTYSDWELIIVDDCSTDKTAEIIDDYAKREVRIKVIHNKENKKLPEALNIGFRKATGEYLTWTSDDNIYMSNAIEKMYCELSFNESIAMVCANMTLIDKEGIVIGKSTPYDERKILYGNYVGACFMYKREVMEKVGEYDQTMFCVEDYDYWLRVLLQFGSIKYINDSLYLYRFHNDSLTTTKKEKIRLQLCKLREKHHRFIFNNLMDKKELLCAIYYDFLDENMMDSIFAKDIFKILPELSCEKKINNLSKRIVIFGAGEIGESAYECLDGKVAFFVDNDKNKQGKMKSGILIKDISAIKEMQEEYLVIVAVSNIYLYQILNQLYQEGISNYITFNLYRLIKD